MTCIRRNLDTQKCCNQWQKGIRTIDGQYPDDNREFGIRGGAGILVTPITAGILITNTTDPAALEAGSNIELTPNGDRLQIRVVDGPTFEDDTTINGDLNVNGNIYNQGASYESHMEQVYTTDDYIIMRENAVTSLAAGSYAGFQVKKYDGTNDGRLVIDNSGVARVGDVGDEQPLLTREESANLNNGALLKWDAANYKAVDEGTVGSDTKPIKIVNGVATPVTHDLLSTQGDQNKNGNLKIKSRMDIGAYTDGGTGATLGTFTVQSSDGTSYQARLILVVNSNNTVGLTLQKLNASGAWQGETIIATL